MPPASTRDKASLPVPLRQFPPLLNKILLRERKSLFYLMQRMPGPGGKINSYIYQLAYGELLPSPWRCDMIADVLRLDGDLRTALHRAAALDHGFKIGAPPL